MLVIYTFESKEEKKRNRHFQKEHHLSQRKRRSNRSFVTRLSCRKGTPRTRPHVAVGYGGLPYHLGDGKPRKLHPQRLEFLYSSQLLGRKCQTALYSHMKPLSKSPSFGCCNHCNDPSMCCDVSLHVLGWFPVTLLCYLM